MADEKKITETTTKTKRDFLGNPKERETKTTEKNVKEGLFGDKVESNTTIERKDEE